MRIRSQMLHINQRRRILQFVTHGLIVVALNQTVLVLAQEATLDDLFDDDQFTGDGNLTLFPTVVESLTEVPSDAPTLPTSAPSSGPIGLPSESPTNFPSDFPTNNPTTTPQPTFFPTSTVAPSDTPTVSLQPSVSSAPSSRPTPAPSGEPSASPSAAPSPQPTISAQPTLSSQPSLSLEPSTSHQPSSTPSSSPSKTPSMMPSTSPAPSSTPSESPSGVPTVSAKPSLEPSVSSAPSLSMAPSSLPSTPPSELPSTSPSASPTTSMPTPLPSNSPSQAPSFPPSLGPTALATDIPTGIQGVEFQPRVTMTLDGLPATLNATQQAEWINVTESHVFNYWNDIIKNFPGTIKIQVNSVFDTNIIQQTLVDLDVSRKDSVVMIEYNQTIDYGLTEVVDEDEMEELLRAIFDAPFNFDSQEYSFALIELWDLQNWVEVTVYVGTTDPPTQAPMPEPPNGPIDISKTAVWTISASVILSSILVVAFLFWDRHRKEKMYAQTHARDFETMEYDNTGQPIDWRNPYAHPMNESGSLPLNDASLPQDGRGAPDGNPSSNHSNSSHNTGGSTLITSTPSALGSRNNRNSSYPPPPNQHPGSSSMASHVLMPGPRSNENGRHLSNADTEITDITYDYSDGQGGGRSDNDSDPQLHGGLPVLPSIADGEQYYGGNEDQSPWRDDTYSPHQVDTALLGLVASEDSDDGNGFLALQPSEDGSVLTGFQMKVEELE